MTKKDFYVRAKENANKCGDTEFAQILDDEINKLLEKERILAERKSHRNRTGVVQVTIEDWEELNRFKSIKEANIEMGLPEKSSAISDAINRNKSRNACGYQWFHTDEWEQFIEENW